MKKAQGGFSLVETILFFIIVSLLASTSLYVYNSGNKVNELLNKPALTSVIRTKSPKKVVAVGDIACDPKDSHFAGTDPGYCQSDKTYGLLAHIKPDAVLALGDLQYENGSLEKFLVSYDKSWGKEKSKTYPVPGNHEYTTGGAAGYFSYFNDTARTGETGKGYYGGTVGEWSIIALNSNCEDVGGCGEGSPQLAWLKQNLSSSKNTCTLAFWHHPHYTSGRYAKDEATKNRSTAFWEELVKHNADIILNGHDHLYERFDLQTADGQKNPKGIRQFTVGTGGKALYPLVAAAANSQKVIDDQFGVLTLELYAKAYRWQFQSVNGKVLDSGYQKCSGYLA